MCHLNLCIKKWGSPSSFRKKRPVISVNCSAFIENLSRSERAGANHVKNDAQKGCAMQLKGITLKPSLRACFRGRDFVSVSNSFLVINLFSNI